MFIMTAAKLVIFGGIITRLFTLQINENKKYLTLSDKNRLREWRLPPVRGDFEDFFGKKIAGNLKVYQLHVVPEQVEDFRYLMIRLRDILDIDSRTFKKILKKTNLIPWLGPAATINQSQTNVWIKSNDDDACECWL